MKFHKPLLGVTLLAASLAVQASTIDWGIHDSAEVGFNLIQNNGIPTGFADIYEFTLAPGFRLSGSAVVANNQIPNLNVTGGTYSLLAYGTDNILGTNDDSFLGTWSYSGTSGDTVNLVTDAGPGKYLFTVSGVANGSVGGGYLITSRVSPVPVPAAALLFSSAMLGVFGLRRKVS